MQGKHGPQWGEATIRGKVVGRDHTVVPPEQVEELAMIGCNDSEIRDFFGIAHNTLTYNFRNELQKGRLQLKQRLRRAMLENAIVKGNVVMQIFLAKNMLGMSDNGMVGEVTILPWTDTFDAAPADDDVSDVSDVSADSV